MNLNINLRDLFWLTLIVAMGVGWSLTARKIRLANEARYVAYCRGYMAGESDFYQWWRERAAKEGETFPEIQKLIIEMTRDRARERDGVIPYPNDL